MSDEIARLTHRLLNDPTIPGLAVIREAIALADSGQEGETRMNNEDLIEFARQTLATHQWTSDWDVEILAERLTERLEEANNRLIAVAVHLWVNDVSDVSELFRILGVDR